jgi:hypothetical protein
MERRRNSCRITEGNHEEEEGELQRGKNKQFVSIFLRPKILF